MLLPSFAHVRKLNRRKKTAILHEIHTVVYIFVAQFVREIFMRTLPVPIACV